MLAIFSSRSLAFGGLGVRAQGRSIELLVELVDLVERLLVASARSSYSFFAAFFASLIFASASLVLLYSLNARFMSTVPTFKVP